MRARLARRSDANAIARIYNQALEERVATFETALRSEDDVVAWFDGVHPIVVVTSDETDEPIGFARGSEYSPRECYRGVFHCAVYVERSARRQGVGAAALGELIAHARSAGVWKLIGGIFVENDASRALFQELGFREVGTYFRHGKLDGRWRDVVIVEKFLAPVGADAPGPARTPARIAESLRSKILSERIEAVGHALRLVEAQQQVESSLIDAAVDAFCMARVHDASARTRFVELFRACAAISGDAARHLHAALFARLEKRSVAGEIDALYEAAYVVKQVARTGERSHVPELVPHVGQLVKWIRETIELPPAMRTRISPGNLGALLLNLALAGCTSDAQRSEVAALATAAKARHRVEPPAVLRSSPPPAPTFAPPVASSDDEEFLLDDEVISVAIPKPPPLPSRVPPSTTEEETAAPPVKRKRAKAKSSKMTKARAPRSKRSS